MKKAISVQVNRILQITSLVVGFALVGMPAVRAEAQCGNDPGNDSLAEATPLSGCGSTPAAIDCLGDLDYYWLNAPNSGSFTFETTGGTDTELRLYDLNGDTIDSDDDSGDGSNAKIVYTLVGGQKYSVAVNEYNYNDTGDYTLVISGCAGGGCGDDPGNDSVGNNTPFGSCGTTAASIDCTDDVDVYSFQSPRAGEYTFTSNGVFGTILSIATGSGNTWVNDGSDSMSKILTTGQWIYVKVEANVPGQIFSYDLTISGCDTACGDDPGDDDFDHATQFVGCSTINSALDCDGDKDFYWFTPFQEGNHDIETLGSTDTKMRLYDSTRTEIADSDDDGGGSNAMISHYLQANQIYYIEVWEFSNQTGIYDLRISCPGGGNCGDDPADDHPAYATPLSGCGTHAAGIQCQSDMDYYSFTAQAGATYTFSVSASYTMNLTLLDGLGAQVLHSGQDEILWTLTAGQDVILKVEDAGSSYGYSYTLEVSGCSGGSCGDDPGNDGLGSATPLSGCGSTAAAIDCVGDLDYYWLNAPNSGSFTFETTGGTDTELRLYDLNGDAIDSDDDSGSGSNAKITYTLVSGQKYSVAVNEYGNNSTGDYTLVVSGCSGGGDCGSDPGNDDTAHATDLGSSCGTTTAGIDCSDDLDFYSFTAPSTGNFTFDASAANSTNITLYTSAGGLLEGPSGSAVSHSLTSGDQVFVRVMAGTDGEVFTYSLAINGCSGGGCGNDPGNDHLAEATELSGCGSTAAAIDCVGDLDYYWLNAPNSGSFTFETTGGTDTELRLYDFNGDVLETDDDDGDGSNASITYTLVSGQKYSVAVNEFGYNDTGDYTLVISGCSGGGCGSDPGNDNLADATALSGCGSTPAAIDCDGDLDYYWLNAPNSGSFTFETTGGTDTELRLYDFNGDAIDSDDDSGSGNNAQIVYTLVSGQKYSVAVNEYGNNGTGDYTLVISGCSGGGCGNDPGNDAVATATDVGSSCGSTSAAFDCATDVDVYKFTVPSDGTYTYTATGGPGVYIYALDSNGNVLQQGGASQSRSETAGTIRYIRVAPLSTTHPPFDYTLEISGCGSQGCGNDPGNDDFGSATGLQGCGTTSAGIDCDGDEDYYSFTPTTDGPHTITLQASFNALVELYDSGHSLLAQENYQISRDLQGASGPYYIAVVGALGLTGTYDLSISGCAAGGCSGDGDGDTIASSTILSGCGSTQSAFDCTGDVDYFKLIAPTSGQYSFETTGAMDTKMWLQDSQGIDLAFDDDSGQGTNAGISYALQSGLSYFVRLEEYNNDDTGSYGLTVAGCHSSSCGQDAEGDTISAAVSLSTCGLTDAEFDCDTDVDVFRFEAPLSVTYEFATLGSQDTFVRLLDGNGNQLTTDDNSGAGSNARFTRGLVAGEAIYLEVTEKGGALGAYQVEIDGCEVTGEPPNEFLYIVTAVAKVAGSEGTNWVSDLVMLNVGESNANVSVARWERGGANTNAQEVQRTLSPGQLERTTDVLLNMFGRSQGGAAALQIHSDQPLVIGSRTYNTVEGKTYGQFIPGVEQHEAIPSGEQVFLPGLAEDHAFRTNLGLVNPGDSGINVTAVFFDVKAQQLGSRTWAVPAHGYIQRNQVLRELTASHMHSIWVRLTTDSGEFFSYFSIVDQQSGDPVYRPGQTSPLLAEDVLIPGVAKLAGAAGTNWVTDATFTNTTSSDASVKISLWNRDGDNSNPPLRSFLLKPERMAQVSDVILSLFGENAGAAALQIAIEPGILADGRTYNQVVDGTYGQYIPGLGEGTAVTLHRKGYLVMPVQNAGFRANLGLVNPSVQPVDVQVRLFDALGFQVGADRSWSLSARAVKQVDRIMRQFTNQNVDSGWLEVSVKTSTPDGQVYIFNSVVDQVSGDPIFETITLGP